MDLPLSFGRNGQIHTSMSWVYYTIPFGFTLFWHFWTYISNFWNYFLWLRITDEGSVPEMRIWSISLVKSDLKWCIHLSRSLFFNYNKRDDFNFHITNFPFLCSNISASPAYGVFISKLIRYARLASRIDVLFWGRHDFQISFSIRQGTLEIVIEDILWSIRGSYQTIVPLSWMLNHIL